MQVLPDAESFSLTAGSQGVLLCHGFTGSPQGVRPWGQALHAAGFTVQAPRLAGHGTRWQDLNRTTWRDWLASARGALCELSERSENVVVGGLSMGASLAFQLAHEFPDVVQAVMVVNPAVLLTDPKLRAVPFLKHVLPAMPGVAGDLKDPNAAELGYRYAPLRAVHSLLHLFEKTRQLLPSVHQPVLLMQSRVDHVVPAASSQYIRDHIGSADLRHVWLDNSYHVATLDFDADTINTESVDFITRTTQSVTKLPNTAEHSL